MNNQSRAENQNVLLTLLQISGASIIIGLIAYFGIMGLFQIFTARVSGMEKWNLLEGFVSVVSLALLIGGGTFAFAEYSEKEESKHLEKLAEEREEAKIRFDVYQTIFEKLTAPEQEAARRWILTNIAIPKDGEDLKVWYAQTNKKIMAVKIGNKRALPEGQEYVKLTLNCFDYIGFIAAHYWNPENDSLDWISAPIAKVWKRIGPYVKHVRTLRGTTDYYVSAEYIGELCVKWRQDKGLLDEIYAEKTL